jgi:hypothetical protein
MSLHPNICKRYSITVRLLLMKKASEEPLPGSLKVGVGLKRNVELRKSLVISSPKINQRIK